MLADGLEEAMHGGEEQSRDSTIRDAIQTANDNSLPLVIASRPYDPLRGMNAASSNSSTIEESYRIGLAVAREIGRGGAAAVEALSRSPVGGAGPTAARSPSTAVGADEDRRPRQEQHLRA